MFTRKFNEQELLDFCRPYYHLEHVQRFGMYYFLTRIVQPLLVAPGNPVTTTKSTRSPAPSPGSIRISRAWATSWRSYSRSGANIGRMSMICLTFDTDYASSDDLRRLLAEHPIPGKATFFLHAPAAGVEWGDHEVEPHPVFRDSEPWEETIAAWEACLSGPYLGLRPHSCATSHILGCIMKRRGYIYSSVTAPLYQAGLRPYRQPWGVYELPIYFMDNMDYCMRQNWPEAHHRPRDQRLIRRAVEDRGLYVFDFHPIHILMNTQSQASYEQARSRVVEQGATWSEIRNPGEGVATFFTALCDAMRSAGVQSVTCLEACARTRRRSGVANWKWAARQRRAPAETAAGREVDAGMKNGPTAIRVLHAPVNVGNQPWVLSRHERAWGIQSDLVVNYPTWLEYPADRCLGRRNDSSWPARWRRLRFAVAAPWRYDVLHLYFGQSFFSRGNGRRPNWRWFKDLTLAHGWAARSS